MPTKRAQSPDVRSRAAGSLAVPLLLTLALAAPALGQEAIYGSQLMTEQQIDAYRRRLDAAGSPAERDRLVYQHYQDMQKRAKQLGIALPYSPPPLPPASAPPGGDQAPAGPRVTGGNPQAFSPPPPTRNQFGEGFTETPGFRVRTGLGVNPGRAMNSWNGRPPGETMGPGPGFQPFTAPGLGPQAPASPPTGR